MTKTQDKDIQLTDEQIKQHLDQIAAISQNARGTWFSLILVLLFSVIAVAGVDDKDFFVFGAGLSLPVIGYTVPVVSFFYAAPVIVLGLYAYLHLYLLNLWHLLGELPCELPDGRQLEDAVYPWIATSAVISLKRKKHHRPFTWLTRLVVFLLVWAAAPGALLYIWWRSVVPHDLLLTSWAGVLAGAALIGGMQSLWACLTAITPAKKTRPLWPFESGQALKVGMITLAVLILIVGELRSKGSIETQWGPLGSDDFLYSAQLYRVELVERPSDWLSHDEAFEKFKVKYSNKARIDLRKPDQDADWITDAKEAFLQERTGKIDSLKQRSLRGIDLRKADLRQAFVAGADLTGANLSGADLNSAIMEQTELNGADLRFARLNDAALSYAELNGAELHGALLNGAVLYGAKLNGAELWGAALNGAELWGAALNGAELVNASFQFAFTISVDFSETSNLTQSQLNSLYAVDTTELPTRLYRPPHWPGRELTGGLALKCWRRWRETEIRLRDMANSRLSLTLKYEQIDAAGVISEPHQFIENIDCT